MNIDFSDKFYRSLLKSHTTKVVIKKEVFNVDGNPSLENDPFISSLFDDHRTYSMLNTSYSRLANIGEFINSKLLEKIDLKFDTWYWKLVKQMQLLSFQKWE